MATVKEWILPGTTIFSDCWAAYRAFEKAGDMHMTKSCYIHKCRNWSPHKYHGTDMVPCEGNTSHTPQGSRLNYCHMADYVFSKKCKEEAVDQFCELMMLVLEMWH
jgi:hypothetical protein